MVKVLRGLAVVLLSLQVLLPLRVQAESPAGQILISEFQTGSITAGVEDPKGEFVELYNSGTSAVPLDGWKLDYLTKTHDGVSAATRTLGTLTGTIEPGSHLLISYQGYLTDAAFYFSGGPSTGYLAKGDGTLRLLDADGQIIDMVGWGSPNNYEEQSAGAPDAGNSLQRCLADGGVVDTDNNTTDFAAYGESTPGGSQNCPAPPVSTSGPSCEGVIISEVLPNPAGDDSGQEFIELYNPTSDFIDLAGCSIEVGSKTYGFVSVELAPEQYWAFYSDVTGLTLPNSAGGTVYLLSVSHEELHAVNYQADLADDQSWSWFGEEDWRASYVPSPGGINVAQPTKPCDFGEIRNPNTGRCVSLGVGSSALKPCAANQERNPATNRCRQIAGSNLVPCKPGQERNPATNRCRSTTPATKNLKPCKPGQERNPETNRCRKSVLASANGTGGVHDVAGTSAASSPSWWFAGIALVAAMAYGIWEWRTEIMNFFRRKPKPILQPE